YFAYCLFFITAPIYLKTDIHWFDPQNYRIAQFFSEIGPGGYRPLAFLYWAAAAETAQFWNGYGAPVLWFALQIVLLVPVYLFARRYLSPVFTIFLIALSVSNQAFLLQAWEFRAFPHIVIPSLSCIGFLLVLNGTQANAPEIRKAVAYVAILLIAVALPLFR